MCGRIVRKTPIGIIAHDFGLEPDDAADVPHFNIAPGSKILAVRAGQSGAAELTRLRWGLIPKWAKDEKIGWKLTNARAETVHEKPAYRDAFKTRRCLIAVDGFYEWRTTTQGKLPYFIRTADEKHFYLGGLWEWWHPPGGEAIETCTILTTRANETLLRIHDRMPVIIPKTSQGAWLDSAHGYTPEISSLLAPLSASLITARSVTTLVNNPKNDSPACLEAAQQATQN
jgi:putative SOS response-associated peptidase YedK